MRGLQKGCELLSKFVSLWLQTTQPKVATANGLLWITFKICTFVISNNNKQHLNWIYLVVNYFQNLYLCDFQQRFTAVVSVWNSCELLSKFVSLWFKTTFQRASPCAWGCELLSKFVSLWFETTANRPNTIEERLWITFKICIFVISNNLLL